MTVPGNIDALLLGGQQGYQIERSLRFNSADSAYLNRTFGTPTDNKKWTFSCWIKRSKLSVAATVAGGVSLFCTQGSGAQGFFGFGNNNDNDLTFGYGGFHRITTTGLFRDLSAWYHIILVFDSANATSADRAIIYINGTRASVTTPNAVGLNDTTLLNSAVNHGIGRQTGQPYVSMDCYLTETHFIDGQALTPSSFGETDTITGVWKPKRYTGTYGTNGFFLNFSDNSGTTSTTLGKDSSGNGNNWTPNNFSVTAGAGNDSMIDTPTPYADGGNGRGNYATLNPLSKIPSTGTASIADGNLSYVGNTTGSTTNGFNASIGISSGKFYWEVAVTNGLGAESRVGILGYTSGNMESNASAYYFYRNNTGGLIRKYDGTSFTDYASYYGTFTSGDIWMFAFDADSGKIWYGKNGSWFNNASGAKDPSTGTNADSTGIPSGTWYPSCAGFTTSASGIVNFGQRAFAYTPPSGFKALNTGNLPEPSIKKPSSYFDTKLYTGTAATLNITGLGFSPDLVWTKNRSSINNHRLYDVLRGTTKELYSNATDAETTDANSLTAFNSDGFTLGSSSGPNNSGSSYVAWCWDESATPGFDIVTYTGNATTGATVSHDLGVKPSMVIVKTRTGGIETWPVWHQSMAAESHFLRLNETSSTLTSFTNRWTAFSSTAITLGNNTETNGNTYTYVAYLWSEVAGFSRFGSYTGNGSADGPFVFCGFRPRFVMIKRTDASANWQIYDTARDTTNRMFLELVPNSSAEENSVSLNIGVAIDALSNGFKLRDADTAGNASGGTYIFAAFAEAPFKYSLAR